jgi:hypothetical protein
MLIYYKGFKLQKVCLREEIAMHDPLHWMAVYENGKPDEYVEAYGATPEEAAERAVQMVGEFVSTFRAPKPIPGEPHETYLTRLAQGFEAWVNRQNVRG